MPELKRTYIIAEAGVNHNGSITMARQLVDAAVDAGADAVKFQTFKAEKLMCNGAPKAEYQIRLTDPGESQLEMVRNLELDEPAHRLIIGYCQERGIHFLSSPFDLDSVDLLIRNCDPPYIKIASGEITNAPLLLKIARTGKPALLSTGMSMLGEVEMALGVLAFGYGQSDESPSLGAFQRAYRSEAGQDALGQKVILLHCTTEYPAPFQEIDLQSMDTLRTAFGLPVGYSDHTTGIAVPVAAVARGAIVVEKHFTLDRALPGPDHKASLEPDELRQMVRSIRQVEVSLGSSLKIPAASEIKNRDIARKSLVAACAIKKGDLLTDANLTCKRPGTGVSPMYYWDWLGKTAGRDYARDELIGP
jgi:N-acetylneuraminate synthase